MVMGPGESVSAALLLVLPLVRRAGFGASPLPLEPQPQPPGLREAVGSNKAVEPVDQEGTSGDEETSGRPASRELSSSTHDLLPAAQPHELCEPPPSPPVAV